MGYTDYVAHQRDRQKLRAMFWWTVAAFAIALLVAVFPYRALYVFYLRHLSPGLSGKAVIEISGVITEYPSGKPIGGAFAVVSLYQFLETGYRKGASQCVGSVTTRTDSQGRYRFRWDWASQRMGVPSKVGTSLSVYKPAMNYWPRRYAMYSVPSVTPDQQLSVDDSPLEDRAEWLDWVRLANCHGREHGSQWPNLLRAVHAEYWRLYCDPASSQGVPLDFKTYVRMESRLLGAHGDYQDKVAFDRTPLQRDSRELRQWWQARRTQTRMAAPSYPWKPMRAYEDPPAPRDFTPQEKALLCAALEPSKMNWSKES